VVMPRFTDHRHAEAQELVALGLMRVHGIVPKVCYSLGDFRNVGTLTRGDLRRKRQSIPLDVIREVLTPGECEWCGSSESLEVDHIVPWSAGGSNEPSNLRPLCQSCNRKRGDARSEGY
jgi:5-methylcytosine-specific restriction endonuclease McrA